MEYLFLLPSIVLVIVLYAEVAHLVERDLAKVEVAGSSPVFRSYPPNPAGAGQGGSYLPPTRKSGDFFYTYPGGGTGRRAGLKILSAEMRVRVRFPSGVLSKLYAKRITMNALPDLGPVFLCNKYNSKTLLHPVFQLNYKKCQERIGSLSPLF